MAVRSREWPGCGGSGDPIEFLVARKLLSHDLAEAARNSGEDPITWLFKSGHIGERDVTMARAHGLGIPFIDLDRTMILFDAYELPAEKAWEIGALPIKSILGKLCVAFRDPSDQLAIREVERITGKPVMPVATPPSRLEQVLNEFFVDPSPHLGRALIRDGVEYLQKKGLVTEAQRVAVCASQDPVRELLDTGVIGEREFAMARAWDCELMFWDIGWSRLDMNAIQALAPDLARSVGILPLRRNENVLKVAVLDPKDVFGLLKAEMASGCRLVPCFVLRASVIQEALKAM